MKNIQNLTIDINKKPFQTITANVGEVASRFIKITILENNIPADLTGVTAYLYAKKADGTKVFNSVKVEDAKQGIVLAELTSQVLAIPGLVKLTLLLTKDSAKLASKQIIVSVDESSIDDEAIESSNEFGALTEALNKVNNIDNKFNELTVDSIREATEIEIQKQIDNGTMASLTIADGSITKEKLDPSINLEIEDNSVTIEKLEFMRYEHINLFNPNDEDCGPGQITGNGSYNTNTTTYHTGYIKVIPGETIYYSAGYAQDLKNNAFIQGYGKDKNIISNSIQASTQTTQVENDPNTRYFTVPSNVHYIRFGYLYNYVNLYQDFTVSREYHRYAEQLKYGTKENIKFSISEKWRPHIFEKLIEGEKIGSKNIENSLNAKIENGNNAIAYLSPNIVKNRLLDETKHDSIRSDVKLLGNIFPQESRYIAWLTNDSFYDKDIDKVVCFYNARESHYGGTGTVNYRTIDKNDPRIVSDYKIACKPEDVEGQTASTNGMVTCSCAILNNGDWMILAKNHSASSNGIDKITTVEVYKSTDKGETWTNWSMKDSEGNNVVPNIGGSYALIQTKTGRILTINYFSNQVRVYYSDDNGLTWNYSVVGNKSSYGNDKLYFGASIIDIDGTLMIIQRVNIREKDIPSVISYSTDNGLTWSDFVDSKTIINAGGSPVCAITHDGVVEVLYGERVAREGESGGRIYHTAATFKDALNDNFLPPKIIGHSNNTGDNFGYFGGCSDDNGNIHVFYYDDNAKKSEGLGCNVRYIKGSFNSKLKLNDIGCSIKKNESKTVDAGISNYRITPTSSVNNEKCTGSIIINSGNLLDLEKGFDDYYEYQTFTNIPSNKKVSNAYYENIFEFKQAFFHKHDCYGQKVSVQPFTDYIISMPICYQPQGYGQGLVVYGNNSFIDFKRLNESEYKDSMCIVFNSEANDEVLISFAGEVSNITRSIQVISPSMNIYKGHSFIENDRKSTNLAFEDYKLRYICDTIRDRIENGVYINQVQTMVIDNTTVNFDSYGKSTTSNNTPYVSWTNRVYKPQYTNGFGSGYSNDVYVACNDSKVECLSYNESKHDAVDNGKIAISLALTYNAPTIDLPFSYLEGVTSSSEDADIKQAIKTYFASNPLTVYLPCPETRTTIEYSPLVLNKDSIVTNNGEGTMVEII